MNTRPFVVLGWALAAVVVAWAILYGIYLLARPAI